MISDNYDEETGVRVNELQILYLDNVWLSLVTIATSILLHSWLSSLPHSHLPSLPVAYNVANKLSASLRSLPSSGYAMHPMGPCIYMYFLEYCMCRTISTVYVVYIRYMNLS